jgi:hypothetical protein
MVAIVVTLQFSVTFAWCEQMVAIVVALHFSVTFAWCEQMVAIVVALHFKPGIVILYSGGLMYCRQADAPPPL